MSGETASQVRANLVKVFGTPYVSDAFKKLYDKYGDKIMDLFMRDQLEEFKYIKDVLDEELGCVDYDIRPASEASILGIFVQRVFDVALFISQIVDYMDFKYTSDINELRGGLNNIAVVIPYNKDPLLLICAFSENEGLIVTHTMSSPIGVVNKLTKKCSLVA